MLGWGLTEKVLGLGQRRGVYPPPPLQPPKMSNTPRGHTLAGGGLGGPTAKRRRLDPNRRFHPQPPMPAVDGHLMTGFSTRAWSVQPEDCQGDRSVGACLVCLCQARLCVLYQEWVGGWVGGSSGGAQAAIPPPPAPGNGRLCGLVSATAAAF